MKNALKLLIDNSKTIIFGLMLIVVGLFTQINQAPYLYLLENNNLFIYDWSVIAERLAIPGGGAYLIAAFLTQFFHLPFVGAIITTLCYGLIVWGSYQIIRKLYKGPALSGLAFLPIVFLLLSLENSLYRYQGHIAFLLMVLALWVYTSLMDKPWWMKWLIGVIASSLLYWFIGSAALVFVLGAILMDILCLTPKWYLSILYIPAAVVMGVLAYQYAAVADWHTAFTPLMYYDMVFTYYFQLYAWGLFLLLPILAILLKYIPFKASIQRFIAVVGAIITCYILMSFYGLVHTASNEKIAKQQYYTEQQDWETVIGLSNPGEPVNFISYLNLALAKQNQLIDKLFVYNQQPPMELTGRDAETRTGLMMAAYVYQSWGCHAAAMKNAFDANLTTSGDYHPRALQLMIQHNLAMGAYEVAEKYISFLEKTLFYRQEAAAYRGFLYRPELVDADKWLGNVKKSIAHEDSYLVSLLGLNLSEIVHANPQNNIALQFYQAYLLLTLDWQFMEEYAYWHRANREEPLPERFQEALASLAQGDPERCKAYGVGEKVMQHYRNLQSGRMPSHYGRSYWKYLYDHGVKF